MEDIKERIKDYVIVLDPEITDDELVDFMVEEVVDRFLVYTNRYQLVDQYEEDLEDETVEEEDYEVPVPIEIERVLARAVSKAYRTSTSDIDREITSLEDNGQKVVYGRLTSYFSEPDDEVFSGYLSLLDKFRIPTIIDESA